MASEFITYYTLSLIIMFCLLSYYYSVSLVCVGLWMEFERCASLKKKITDKRLLSSNNRPSEITQHAYVYDVLDDP